jgi:hypothetical protein
MRSRRQVAPADTANRRVDAAVCLLVVVALACQPRPSVVSGRDLVEAPAEHDGKRIVLVGTVENPRQRVPARGNSYTSFVVADGTARVPVIAWGTQPVGAGDLVEVRGVFHDRMETGGGDGDVLEDVVEGNFVRPLRRGPGLPGTPVNPP